MYRAKDITKQKNSLFHKLLLPDEFPQQYLKPKILMRDSSYKRATKQGVKCGRLVGEEKNNQAKLVLGNYI